MSMSDHEPHFSPGRLEPYPKSSCRCQCCSDHRRSIEFLIADLEAERASAATAAEESMSMIMRLQREKADAKLETIHVRRLAEDQIRWYQMKINIFEEVVKKKEAALLSLSTAIQICKKVFDDLPQRVNQQLDHNRITETRVVRQSPNSTSTALLSSNISESIGSVGKKPIGSVGKKPAHTAIQKKMTFKKSGFFKKFLTLVEVLFRSSKQKNSNMQRFRYGRACMHASRIKTKQFCLSRDKKLGSIKHR